jgi:predicted TIM-barrel fold metal-dependent hydrolase
MQRLAAAPQVSVKISGLGLRGQLWRADKNDAIIRDTIEIFGWDRCLFASNFPVDGLCGDMATIFAGFATAVAHLPWAQRAALFHDNALRVYRLDRAFLVPAPECPSTA